MQESPNKLKPVIFGTLLITFISTMPFLNIVNIFFCGGVIFGGYMASLNYYKQCASKGVEVTTKDSVMIGVLSGFLSAIIVSVVSLLVTMFSGVNPVIEAQEIMNSVFKNIPPEVQTEMNKISEDYTKFGFSRLVAVFTLVTNLITFPIFSGFGGILSLVIMRKRDKK